MVDAIRRVYAPVVNHDRLRRTRADILRLADGGLDWVTFSTQATEHLRRIVPFQRSCWHTVDPGTVLLTGSLNQNVGCSGSWLAEHEYVLDDVNKWSFLARSGRQAGATSLATHGDLSRSARHRSQEAYGIGDELRGSFVVDGTYWAAAGFLRDEGEPGFTVGEVEMLASLCEPLAVGFRRALLSTAVTVEHPADDGPGVVVFDEHGDAELISPAAERWIDEMVEVPPPSAPAESKMVRVIAARARAASTGQDPLEIAARSRVQTRSGSWLLLYGTRLAGSAGGRTAVIIQPAAPRGRPPRRPRLRAIGSGVPGDEALHSRPLHQADGNDARGVAVHGSGPPQVDLRQDGSTQPRRTSRPGLSGALRPAVGATARLSIRMVRARLTRARRAT